MGKGMQMILTVLLATCVMLGSTQTEISTEKVTDVTFPYVRLRGSGAAAQPADVGCTAEGAFPLNCTSYRICLEIKGIGWVAAVENCPPNQNLDPVKFVCSEDYRCKEDCTRQGYTCLSRTKFTICPKLGEPVGSYDCPTDYRCNSKCSVPCVQDITDC